MERNYTEKYKVPDVPEGEVGKWKIKKFEVKKTDMWKQMTSMMDSGRYVPEGWYTGLFRKSSNFNDTWEVIMSDTPDELWDMVDPIREATGRVLIAGLGLGVVLNGVLMNPAVTHVDVIELSEDVLALVKTHYEQKYPGKITFIQANILEWIPPKDAHWNYAWFDIWDGLCTDNLPEMGMLHRRYCKKADVRGSWGRELLQSRRRQERAQEKMYEMFRPANRYKDIDKLSEALDGVKL